MSSFITKLLLIINKLLLAYYHIYLSISSNINASNSSCILGTVLSEGCTWALNCGGKKDLSHKKKGFTEF